MPALLLLAIALGLDNLAASLAIGAGGVSGRAKVRIAVVFGLFEAGMPVVGLALGHGLADAVGQAARWLGGGVLVAFGVAGLIRAWRGLRRGAGPAPGRSLDPGRNRAPGRNLDAGQAPAAGGGRPRGRGVGRLLVGGLVLSGDNLAAGFALGAYHISLAVAAVVFGVVSVAMSLVGLELGARIGTVTGERSELVACALLVVVGVVIVAGAG